MRSGPLRCFESRGRGFVLIILPLISSFFLLGIFLVRVELLETLNSYQIFQYLFTFLYLLEVLPN